MFPTGLKGALGLPGTILRVLLLREASDEKAVVFITPVLAMVNIDASPDRTLRVGDGIRFGTARNPKMVGWTHSA